MKITLYSTTKAESQSIARFFTSHNLTYEFVGTDKVRAVKSHLFKLGEMPVVEVDGVAFVNPNDDALRHILNLDESDEPS
jgi:alpha-acetolactate decarboxylase